MVTSTLALRESGEKPSPLNLPSRPPASPLSLLSPLWWVGNTTSGLAPIAQDASWLTVVTVPHSILPVLGLPANAFWGPRVQAVGTPDLFNLLTATQSLLVRRQPGQAGLASEPHDYKE